LTWHRSSAYVGSMSRTRSHQQHVHHHHGHLGRGDARVQG
jgi:hypothetical protein